MKGLHFCVFIPRKSCDFILKDFSLTYAYTFSHRSRGRIALPLGYVSLFNKFGQQEIPTSIIRVQHLATWTDVEKTKGDAS